MRQEFSMGYLVQLWTAVLLWERVVLLQTGLSLSDQIVKDVSLCNGSFDGWLLEGPVSLRLPDIQPQTYGQPIRCTYSFYGIDPFRVALHITELHTGVYNNVTDRCSGGHLQIWDGSREPGHHQYPPNTFCGNYRDSEIDVVKISTRQHAEMDFYAKEIRPTTSFRVIIHYIDTVRDAPKFKQQIRHSMKFVESSASICSWKIQLEDCDHECPIISPGYPGIYPPNIECFYHITSQNPNVNIQIQGTSMAMSHKPREFNLRRSCQDHYLDVYDAPSNKDLRLRIGHFCGEYLPSITSSSNNMFLVFSSGPDAPPYNYTGFHISAVGVTKEWHQDSYHPPDSICGWIFNSTAGSVSSPEHWLPPKSTCEYGFNVNSGHYLEIILNVYGLDRYCQDYILVIDGDKVISKLCDSTSFQSRDTFIFNMTSPYVIVQYYTAAGQMEGRQSRGFWLSFRQIYDPFLTSNEQSVIHYAASRGSQGTRPTSMSAVLTVPLAFVFIRRVLSLCWS